jgi:hypothetical protein
MQQELFEQEPQPENQFTKKKITIEFTPPKNIVLGQYYLTKGGRVIHPMFYVASSVGEMSYEIKLQIRIGREEPFEYKDTDIESFSKLIEQKMLIRVQ